MPDYSQGKIYAIRSYQTDEIYIGSTIAELSRRLTSHVTDYKCWLGGTGLYKSSFAILDYPDYYIELIEKYPCQSREELCQREGHHIRNNPTACNFKLAGRSKKEYTRIWHENHKDYLKEYNKRWEQENKEYRKQYREAKRKT